MDKPTPLDPHPERPLTTWKVTDHVDNDGNVIVSMAERKNKLDELVRELRTAGDDWERTEQHVFSELTEQTHDYLVRLAHAALLELERLHDLLEEAEER